MAAPSTCHPERPSVGRGLCRNCYNTAWRKGQIPHRKTNVERVADIVETVHEALTRLA